MGLLSVFPFLLNSIIIKCCSQSTIIFRSGCNQLRKWFDIQSFLAHSRIVQVTADVMNALSCPTDKEHDETCSDRDECAESLHHILVSAEKCWHHCEVRGCEHQKNAHYECSKVGHPVDLTIAEDGLDVYG